MKTQILLLIMIVLFSACSSKEDKARDLIKLELAGSMDDFKSYESVSFGKLDSDVTYFDEFAFRHSDTLVTLPKSDVDLLINKAKHHFKPQFKAYAMLHSYRGKNSFGTSVLNRYWFYFDRDLTKVTKTVDDITLQKEIIDGSNDPSLMITPVDTTALGDSRNY